MDEAGLLLLLLPTPPTLLPPPVLLLPLPLPPPPPPLLLLPRPGRAAPMLPLLAPPALGRSEAARRSALLPCLLTKWPLLLRAAASNRPLDVRVAAVVVVAAGDVVVVVAVAAAPGDTPARQVWSSRMIGRGHRGLRRGHKGRERVWWRGAKGRTQNNTGRTQQGLSLDESPYCGPFFCCSCERRTNGAEGEKDWGLLLL
jgi:hypothetical protein